MVLVHYGAIFHSEWQKECEASKSRAVLMMMMTMMARWRVRFSNQNDNGFPKLAANSLLASNPALPFFQQRTNWHSTATLNFVPLLIFCSSLSFICRYNQVSFDLHWEIPLLRYTASNSNQTALRRKIILNYCFQLFDISKCSAFRWLLNVVHCIVRYMYHIMRTL